MCTAYDPLSVHPILACQEFFLDQHEFVDHYGFCGGSGDYVRIINIVCCAIAVHLSSSSSSSFPRITHSLPNGKQGTLVFTAGDTPSARKNKLGELEVVGVVFVLTHSSAVDVDRYNCSEPERAPPSALHG